MFYLHVLEEQVSHIHWEGKINLRNSKFKKDHSPLDPDNDLRDLNMYSKSYLNHLVNTNEILASMLISLAQCKFLSGVYEKNQR